ncbi:MAG: STAS domain-containing protein, partial [Alphaproteobacteria bacterium]
FGAAKGLSRRVMPRDDHRVLILDLSDVTFVDTSASMALEDIIVKSRKQGLDVYLVGLRGPVAGVLGRLGVLDALDAKHLFQTRLEALTAAKNNA